MDPIAAAIAAAKNASPAPAPAEQAPSTNVVPYVAARKNIVLSAGDMMTGSFNVDVFAKVTADGIKIGDKGGLITDPFDAVIDLSEAYYYWGVKYGNPAVYQKTTNQVTSLTGQPWGQILATGAQVDGAKFKGVYRSGDIPFTLIKDVKDLKGNVVAEAGTRVGKSLSTTEWKEYEGFLRSVAKAGLSVDNTTVVLKVSSKSRKNPAGNSWGVLTFTLVGELVTDESGAA